MELDEQLVYLDHTRRLLNMAKFSLEFNPTYNEAKALINKYESEIDLYEDTTVSKCDTNCLEDNLKEYHEMTSVVELLKNAIIYSMITTKIRKFGNVTLDALITQAKVAEREANFLHRYVHKLIECHADDDSIDEAYSAYDRKLDEVNELQTKIDYIEANYKVDVSSI